MVLYKFIIFEFQSLIELELSMFLEQATSLLGLNTAARYFIVFLLVMYQRGIRFSFEIVDLYFFNNYSFLFFYVIVLMCVFFLYELFSSFQAFV